MRLGHEDVAVVGPRRSQPRPELVELGEEDERAVGEEERPAPLAGLGGLASLPSREGGRKVSRRADGPKKREADPATRVPSGSASLSSDDESEEVLRLATDPDDNGDESAAGRTRPACSTSSASYLHRRVGVEPEPVGTSPPPEIAPTVDRTIGTTRANDGKAETREPRGRDARGGLAPNRRRRCYRTAAKAWSGRWL